jgi:prophage tail gpP-like protein
MPDVELTVNGLRYGGWKSARVTRGIESVAGGFELTVSDRWQAGAKPWEIYEEDLCTLKLAGETVISGYVDRVSLSYDASNHGVSVAGRDKTGALVDCSVFGVGWEFANTPAQTIIARLADPFGITVSVQGGLTIPALPDRVAVDPGESVFDAIEKICRKVGVLAVSDGSGGLLLMRPGSSRTVTALVEGENILAGSATFDGTGRYRRYVVLGQHSGSDNWFGEGTAGVTGEATDGTVLRGSRVLVVRPEGNVTAASARRRAEWEATVRAARGDSVSVTVQGWTQGNGALWPVNALVRVQSPRLRVDGDMLITEVTHETGDQGTTTQLTLRTPGAFAPESTIAASDQTWKEIRHGV